MIGIDEVGRGCLAGPLLVVAARSKYDLPAGLKDSKELGPKKRQKIFDLLSYVCDFGEGWVSPVEIDEHGLAEALRLGVSKALSHLKAEIDEEIIMDGPVNYISTQFIKAKCLIDADALVPIVSAASIYAKVTRDKHMKELKKTYPNFGFENHVGYGTKAHMLAIKRYGPIANLHRMSFGPLKLADNI